MNELVEKLLKLKTPAKIGVTVGLAALIAVIYNFMFYADLADGIAAAKGQQDALKEERKSYERRKAEYLAYRNELVQLQEQQRELLRALPKRQEIPSFIGSLQEQAELSGLEIISLNIGNEVPEELYVRIPVQMQVRGGYHSITRFFRSLSELRRIVNVEDLSLAPEAAGKEESGVNTMRAKFVAATFRYAQGEEG